MFQNTPIKIRLFAGAAALFIILCGIFIYAYATIPGRIENSVISVVKSSFNTDAVTYGSITTKGNLITIKDVNLDRDEISTAEEINIYYNPLTYLFTGRLHAVKIDNLSYYFDTFTFDGLSGPSETNFYSAFLDHVRRVTPPKIPLIIFKNASLNFPFSFGGVTVNGDLTLKEIQAAPGDDITGDKTTFQFSGQTAQKPFSARLYGNGFYTNKGAWHAEINAEDLKIDRPPFKMTRGYYVLQSDGGPASFYTKGEITAGLLTYAGIDLGNITGTVEHNSDLFTVFITGIPRILTRFENADNMQATISYSSKTPSFIQGQIFAEDRSQLAALLEGTPFSEQGLTVPDNSSDIHFYIGWPLSNLTQFDKKHLIAIKAQPDFQMRDEMIISAE